MRKIASLAATAMMLALPLTASAHGHASYLINGIQYDIVIGSLNEPVTVDDKTGVDLRVSSGGRMVKAEDGDMETVGGKPLAGLENDLKVELIAGEKKKVLDFSPVYNSPGAYKAPFYPTVATTYSYRIFGTINSTPFDVTYTCRSEGATTADEGEKEISAGVKQLIKGGGFGCPTEKAALGFPEESASITDLNAKTSSNGTMNTVALALGALGVVLGGAGLVHRRNWHES